MTDHTIRLNVVTSLPGIKAATDAVTKMAGGFDVAEDSMKSVADASRRADDAIRSMSKAMDQFQQSSNKGYNAQKKLNIVMQEGAAITNKAFLMERKHMQGTGDHSKKLAAQKQQWNHLGRAIRGQPKNFKMLARNIRRVSEDLKVAGRAGVASHASIDALTTGGSAGFKRLLTDTEKYRIKLNVIKKGIKSVAVEQQRLGKNAQWIGRQMMVGITLPLSILAQKLISAYSGVEQEFVRLAKVIDDPAIRDATDAMDKYGESVKAISSEFAVSQKLTAGVMADYAAMGEQGPDLEFLTALSEKIALVGEMDVSDATNLITSLRQTFDLEVGPGESLEHILDVFNSIENATPLLFGDLAEAFPQVAGAAKFLNLEIEETAAILAGMRAAGFDASEAAHSLKFGLTRMAAGPKAAGEALDTLGVKLYDNNGVIRDMGTVLGELGDSLNFIGTDFDATETELKAMEDLFGTRQIARMGAALEQINKPGSMYAKAMEAAAAATGSVNRETAIAQESFTYKWNQVKVEIQQIMADLGAAIIDPALLVMKAFKGMLEFLNKFPETLKKVIAGLGFLAAALGPIIFSMAMVRVSAATAFGGLSRLIPGLGDATADLAKELMDLDGKVLAQLGDGFTILSDKADETNDILRETADRYSKISTEAGTAAGSIDEATSSLMKAQNEALEYGDSLGDATAGTGKGFDPETGEIIAVPSLKKNADEAAESLGELKVEAEGADNALDGVGVSGKKAADKVDDVGDASKKVKKGKFSDSITKMFLHPLKSLKKMFTSVGAKISVFFKALAGFSLKGAFGSVLGWLKNIPWGSLLKFAKIGLKIGVVVTVIMLAIEAIKSLSKHWDNFLAGIKPGIDAVSKAWGKLVIAWRKASKEFDHFGASMNKFSEDNDGEGFWKNVGDALAWLLENAVVPLIDALTWFTKYLLPEIIEWVARMWASILEITDGVINKDFAGVMEGFGHLIYELIGRPLIDLFGLLVEMAFKTGELIVEGLTNQLLGGFLNSATLPLSGPLFGIGKIGELFGIDSPLQESLGSHIAGGLPDISADSIGKAGKDAAKILTDEFHDALGIKLPEDDGTTSGWDYYNDLAKQKGKEIGEDAADEVETNFNPEPEIDNEAWEKAFEKFSSRVYSNIDKIVAEVKKSATDALKKHHENILNLYDLQIESIDEVTRKEKELADKREYQQRRREMLETRALQVLNYQKNRALAIYEGRVDDARMLDLEERSNARDHAKSLGDLEADRQQAITDALRNAEKDRIKITKDAHADRLKIEETAFRKQLDLIT